MYRVLAAIVLVGLLTGCTRDQRVLDDLGMIQSSSYDLEENNKIKVTINIPIAASDSTVKRMVLTTVTNTSKEARIIFSRQTELILVSGQLRNTLFGMEIAKAGLKNHIDTLLRDPSIALGVKVTIVDGEASDLLTKTYKQHADTGQYIDHMLEKEDSKSTVPATNLYEFSRDINDDGIDPIVPIIKDIGDNVEIKGIALLQDYRYKMKISVQKGLIFSLFKKSLNEGELSIDLGESNDRNETVMFNSILNKRKVKVHHLQGNHFKVDITATMRGSVLEYTGEQDLDTKEGRNKLEAEMSEYISSQAQQLVKEMQENEVDSLGIGQYVRNSLSYAEWKSMNWRKVYPQVEVECHAKVIIKNHGKYK